MKLIFSIMFFLSLLQVHGTENSDTREIRTADEIPDTPPVLLCPDYSEEEIHAMMEAALDGSQDNARYLYFEFIGKNDNIQALYWAQIAMENGSQEGRKYYVDALVLKGDMQSLKRARYHLNKMMEDDLENKEDLIVIANNIEGKLIELGAQ